MRKIFRVNLNSANKFINHSHPIDSGNNFKNTISTWQPDFLLNNRILKDGDTFSVESRTLEDYLVNTYVRGKNAGAGIGEFSLEIVDTLFEGILDKLSVMPTWAGGFRMLTKNMIGKPIYELQETNGGTTAKFSIAYEDMDIIKGERRGTGVAKNSFGQTFDEWLSATGAANAKVRTVYDQVGTLDNSDPTQTDTGLQPLFDPSFSSLNNMPAAAFVDDDEGLSSGIVGAIAQGEVTGAVTFQGDDISGSPQFIFAIFDEGALQILSSDLNRTPNKHGISWGGFLSADISGTIDHDREPSLAVFKRTGVSGDWDATLFLNNKLNKSIEGETTNPGGSDMKILLGALIADGTPGGSFDGGLPEWVFWDFEAPQSDVNLYSSDNAAIFNWKGPPDIAGSGE